MSRPRPRHTTMPPRFRRPPPRSPDAGQTVALVALIVAAIAGAAVLVGVYGGLVVDRTRAKDAADAAALAGAVDGESAARSLAEANHGTLEQFRRIDERTVEVTVRVGRARATSRAEPIVVQVRAGVPGPPPRSSP